MFDLNDKILEQKLKREIIRIAILSGIIGFAIGMTIWMILLIIYTRSLAIAN